jgi:hypothetical protein
LLRLKSPVQTRVAPFVLCIITIIQCLDGERFVSSYRLQCYSENGATPCCFKEEFVALSLFVLTLFLLRFIHCLS